MTVSKYIDYFLPIFENTSRTKEIFYQNPTIVPERKEATEVIITIHEFDSDHFRYWETRSVAHCIQQMKEEYQYWINVDGLRKSDVDALADFFNIHGLLSEDILSVAQRPKTDEIEGHVFSLFNMLYFLEPAGIVEQEQISILLGKNYVISFQEDAGRDIYDSLREKLKSPSARVRNKKANFLYYTMIDMIVDSYFIIIEKLSERIELLEEEIIRKSTNRTLPKINFLRKELIVLKRNVLPVRDVVSRHLSSDHELLEDDLDKYFKDVYDHIIQAADLVENYRDMMMSLQDLYLNQVNIRMNEVMKVMAITTCLMAPATVIGGIFGMNFDRIPWLHDKYGFFIAVSMMIGAPLYMVWIFRKRGWFRSSNLRSAE